ncbi:MAG TPA: hypothetical protein P5136_01700 [Methanofastidiosum sp.]|nr:hypothetical protein [Methanofastidiosum sp.]
MKKIFILMFLFISTMAFARMYVIEKRSYGNMKITVMCIDGYKFLIVAPSWDTSSQSGVTVEQMKKNMPAEFGSVMDTCKK